MSRSLRRAIALTTATVAVAAPFALTHDAAGARTTTHTIRFTSHMLAGQQMGANGFAGADKLVRNGKVVGFDAVRGSIAAGGTVHLRGTAALAGGLLYLTGTVHGTSGTGKVVGGTGIFQGAHGTITDTIVDPDRGIVSSVVTWSR